MCAKGWHLPRYNPSSIRVVTHEIAHDPAALDLRGGPRTADHIDLLGNFELLGLIGKIAGARGEEISDRYYSRIREMTDRVKWH